MSWVPEEYRHDLRHIIQVYESVEETHRGLGKLAIAVALHDRADMALFVVGLAGTGKSAVSSALLNTRWRHGVQMRDLTKASLARWGDDLQGFHGTIVVDDLARCDSNYIMKQTYKTLIELCFNHGTDKATFHYRIQISNFYASVIFNVQPILFREIIGERDWDAFVRDRAARYYHLYRPIEPNPNPPRFNLTRREYSEVTFNPSSLDDRLGAEALARLTWQFSKGRSKLYFVRLAKASAALNDRDEVCDADLWLIGEIYRNSLLEHLLTSATEFEGRRRFNSNLYAILSEFATLKQPIPINDLCHRYGYSKQTIYNIVRRLNKYCTTSRDTPPTIIPTEEMRQLMREVGVEWE